MFDSLKQVQALHCVGLIGQGIVYQNVKRHIEGIYRTITLTIESFPQQLSACKIIVYCSDTWSPRTLREINCRCLQSDVALLPVYTYFAEGIIGPCVVPQQKGCANCAELRKLAATSAEAERELLQQHLFTERDLLLSQPWLSSFSLETLVACVGEEITTYIDSPDQIRTGNAFLSISLESLDCRRHSFLPLSSCPDCGEMTDDAAETATLSLHTCPKPDVFTYRSQQHETTTEQLRSEYVDERAGLIYSLTTDNQNLFPISSSLLSSELRHGDETMVGTGCRLNAEQSKAVSILEAVERYAGLCPRSKRTIVRASYQQLVQQNQSVLDPTTLGLHGPEHYEYHNRTHNCHHLTLYHPDLLCNWVWGYSFQRQSPILVPEHCAYYGIPASCENPTFIYDVSNGCALGSCLEEAIFHGMMEIVERDAFLMMWYAQLDLPLLNLSTITNPMLRAIIEHIEHHSGYTIYAFNATLDHGIPCLCLLGVDEQNCENMPKAHIAAGSHVHPEQALLRALREFTTILGSASQLYQQRKTEALEMFADSNRVHTMYDHPLVYYLPQAFDRLHFLYHTQRRQTFEEAFSDFYHHPPEHMDLQDDLEYLINYYLKRGLNTIVVDQTAPEHGPCGLHCVKVLMPGMLPMTFGQSNRRIIGLERLYQLPYMLGYRDHPLSEAEINPYPHPFV